MDYSSVVHFGEELFIGLTAGVLVDWGKSRKRVRLANHEVLQVVHRLIADQDAQSVHRINSIITSVARKYRLNTKRLYDLGLLVDEAINEIVGDPFLSAKQKQEYCTFADRIKNENDKLRIAPESVSLTAERRRDIGVILVAAVLGATLFSFLGSNLTAGITLDKDALRRVFWMAAIAITVPAFFLWLLDLYRGFSESKDGHRGRRTLDKLLGMLQKRKRRS